MKRNNWEVKDYGIRPAGDSEHCFYCGEPKGSIHKEDCVIRSRTVVIKMEAELVVDVPEFWDEEQINFHRNKGSWCATNVLSELERLDNRLGCLCGVLKFKYLREATEEDEESQKIYVKDFES